MTIFMPPEGSTSQTGAVAELSHYAQAQQISRLHRPSLRKSVRKFLKQSYSFLVAISSPLWKKRLTRVQYEARIAACLGCEQLQRKPGVPVGWCNACGCKKTGIAELTVKANLPGAKCPKGKWDGQPVPAANET